MFDKCDTYEERSCNHPKEDHRRPLTPAEGQAQNVSFSGGASTNPKKRQCHLAGEEDKWNCKPVVLKNLKIHSK